MDTNKIRDNQNFELGQLNQDYQKRKEKLIEQREKEISQVEKHYDEKEENLRTQSEAVINHLRHRTKESVQREKTDAEKSLDAAKKSLTSEKRVYDKNLAQQRQLQQERLKAVSGDFEAQRQDTIESYHNDIERIQAHQAKTIKDTQDHYQKKLTTIQAEEEKNLAASQTRGQTQVAKVTQNYQEQIAKLHNDGDRKLISEKTNQEQDFSKLRSQNKKDRETEQKSNAQQIELERKTSRDRYEQTKEIHKQEMARHNDRFNEQIQMRQKQMEKNLVSQDRLFNREILKQKLDWAQKVEPFESQMEDPFYKLIDRKSDFQETESAYVLKAYVPLYDRKSIQINVQPDKVSVQGNRTFKDSSLNDERKVSSQQFQTFREEFSFGHPIVESATLQERDGDFVKVTIPKLLSTSNKRSSSLG
jgi:HSP20 family molecular chaperone IbpA